MTLTRDWYPTRNYSYRSYTTRLIVVHTTEGWQDSHNGMYDCAIYFQGDVGASAHVCIDNFHPNRVAEGVKRENAAWTQCNCNGWSLGAEQCALASWSRDYWLNNRGPLLKNTAAWIAEEANANNIPIRWLSASEAQSGMAGVTDHYRLGPNGCGHHDCGDGYPSDKVIEWALGGAPIPPQEQGPIAGEDYMEYPGKVGQWLTYQEDVCEDQTVFGRGLGTDGTFFYVVREPGTTNFRGPTRVN